MLSIIQRPIPNSSNGLAQDQKRVAIQIVRSSACHNYCAREVEIRQDHSEQWPSPFVDGETQCNTEKSVDLCCQYMFG